MQMEADLSSIVNRLIKLNRSYDGKLKEEDLEYLRYAIMEQIKNVKINLFHVHELLTKSVTAVSTIFNTIAKCNAALEKDIVDDDLVNLLLLVSKYPMKMQQVEKLSDKFKIIYDKFFDSISKICLEAVGEHTNATGYWSNLHNCCLSGKLMNNSYYKVTIDARGHMKELYERCVDQLVNLVELHNESRLNLSSPDVDEREEQLGYSGSGHETRGEDEGNEE